ncbi:hypothetical protein PHYBOEH_011450 [Phytophthora boehmeriae]|uniref:RRM domain-containing protein n=1 Tax=Phytophthora boehmeriae TaxID=109152 RepID=A0A8T1WX82_9STRA|nr:hypothetical protein PHYBOEH_011450 [Phytophthora boehmeriae]
MTSPSRSRSGSRSSARSISRRSSSGNMRKSFASRSRSASPKRSRSNSDTVMKADDKETKSPSIKSEKPVTLRVENLTRNVNADHLREIFGKFGVVLRVEIAVPRGKASAIVAFATQKDADSAKDHMHDGWLDGNKLRVLADVKKPEENQRSNGANAKRTSQSRKQSTESIALAAVSSTCTVAV